MAVRQGSTLIELMAVVRTLTPSVLIAGLVENERCNSMLMRVKRSWCARSACQVDPDCVAQIMTTEVSGNHTSHPLC